MSLIAQIQSAAVEAQGVSNLWNELFFFFRDRVSVYRFFVRRAQHAVEVEDVEVFRPRRVGDQRFEAFV